ncbi:MAG: FtsQ-type POTRA domain-containing protein [Endomicrobium sp.]|jgi:cell division protein FtsQ|nr:FtsQ-type POTRA domain-containing protein [Endomicrobium sp.]
MSAKRKKYSYQRRVVIMPNYTRSSKKGRKLGKLFVYICIFVLICFLAYAGGKKLVGYVYASESMTIKEIDVTGCKNVTKTEIKALLPFKIGDNILKINVSEAESKIMEVKPELKDISIKRRWQKVKIKLYERTPEAFIVFGNDVLGIDFEDKPFPLRGFMSGMKIPTIIYKTDAERSEILKFIKIFKPVCDNFFDNIAKIEYSNSHDIVFKTYDGTVIYWGEERPEHMDHKYDKLRRIYADADVKYEHIELIDMSFYEMGKAVVKPKAQEPLAAAQNIN